MKKILASLSVILTLAGCGTSPEPDYYLLTPVDGTASVDIQQTLTIERPSLPDYLDRPGIVRQIDGTQITIDDMHRWAAPLDTMFEDVLAADLQQRLPSSSIFREKDDLTTRSRIAIETEIENFNGTNDGAILNAQLTFRSEGVCIKSKPRSITFKEASSSTDQAPALSELIGKLADQVVVALQKEGADEHCCEKQNSLCPHY